MRTDLLALTLIWIGLLLSACSYFEEEQEQSWGHELEQRVASQSKAFQRFLDDNPCGVLHIQRPIFNVSGEINGSFRPGNTLHLFVTRNSSRESVRYAVTNCRPISKAAIDGHGRFTLNVLPKGTYAVKWSPSHPATGHVDLFFDPINQSGYQLVSFFIESNSQYVIAAFSLGTD